MNTAPVIETLNELLGYESNSLLPRLADSTIFVSWATADEAEHISNIIDEDIEHQAWLVEAIRDLGGEPASASPDVRSAELHFLDLGYVLPRVLADRERLLRAYESAAARIGSNAHAAAVIAKITQRHRRHIETIANLIHRSEQPAA